MIFSLDYDGTYDRAPEFWNEFVASAEKAGHKVICLTMRYPHEPVEMPCKVIYTSRAAKKPFADRAGIKIDVWIDDSPRWLLHDG